MLVATWWLPYKPLGLYVLSIILNETNTVLQNTLLVQFYTKNIFKVNHISGVHLLALIPVCGRTAWIIPAQVRRPLLYRRHDLNTLQTEQPNGLSGNVLMKPPDSELNKRTSHEGKSRYTITVIFLQHRHK
jgi:hypothetical protein